MKLVSYHKNVTKQRLRTPKSPTCHRDVGRGEAGEGGVDFGPAFTTCPLPRFFFGPTLQLAPPLALDFQTFPAVSYPMRTRCWDPKKPIL